MRNLVLTTLAAGALGLMALPADALPAGGLAATPLPLASGQPETTLVSGGCGIYRHRGFNGLCYSGGGFVGGYGRGFGYGRGYGYRRFGYGRDYGYRRF